MKIPLILSLLIGGAVGSQIISDNIANNTKQEVVVADKEKNNDILTAYIDGENKVYLNDISDSEIVEDSWSYNETKILKLKIDASKLNEQNRFVEISTPLGVEIVSDPLLLVDGKNILSVDTSKFQQSEFLGMNGTIYRPKTGEILYEISPTATVITLDIFLSLDYTLLNTEPDDVIHSDNYGVTVSLNSNEFLETKKIDYIKSKDNLNHVSWSFRGNNSHLYPNKESTLGIYVGLSKEDRKKFFKNIHLEIDIPFLKDSLNESSKKQLAKILKVGVTGNSYRVEDDKILIDISNFYGNALYVDIDFSIGENFEPLSTVKSSIRNVSFRGALDDVDKSLIDRELEWMVVDSTQENISYEGLSTKTHKNDNKDTLNLVGAFVIENKGGDTLEKDMKIDFPKKFIGVKAIRAPLISSRANYTFNIEMFNAVNNSTLNRAVEITDNDSSSYLIHVDEILKDEGISSKELSNFYLSSIEYSLGSIPTLHKLGQNGWSSNGSPGHSYGRTLENSKPNDFSYIDYYIKNSSDSTYEKKMSSKMTITSSGESSFNLTSISMKDFNNNNIESIICGEDFLINGKIEVYGYKYSNTMLIKNPVLHVVLPRGILLDELDSYFKTNNTNLNYKIINKSNPRELEDGNLVYDIEIGDGSDYLGFFNNSIKQIGYIDFSLKLKVSKSTKSLAFNPRERLFVTDKSIKNYCGGSNCAFYVADTRDVDGNGNSSEKIATIDKNINLNIVSNSSWLNTEDSLEISGSSQSSSNLVLETNEDKVKYNINIDNNNEGYVRAGNFEYYIPIPKKEIDYNSNIKDDDEVFNFNMVLNEKVTEVPGFEIAYSYNNINFIPYNEGVDLSKVSMVRIVNTEDINPNDQLQFSVKMNYEEASWDGSSGNDVIWSAYGNQVYEKNGGESGYIHVMDKIKLEIVKAPIIKENLVQITANVNDRVSLDAVIDLGIPLANIKWKYRTASAGPWIDLSEPSKTLVLENIDYSMNGYQYRYEASNKGGSVTSNTATLIIVDNSSPIIKLTEIRDGENYKIRIDVTDEDNGVSHIILPDGTRVDGDTYTIDAEPNFKYVFKAYDLAGNEAISDMTIVNGLAPGRVTANLDVYIKSENMLSLSLNSNSISFNDFNGAEDLQQDGVLEFSINSSLPYEINAYLQEEIQNADKSETMDKSILNLKESSDSDYKEFVDIKTKLNLVSHVDAGNNKIHNFDFKLNGGIAHKKDVYKATIKFEVKQK